MGAHGEKLTRISGDNSPKSPRQGLLTKATFKNDEGRRWQRQTHMRYGRQRKCRIAPSLRVHLLQQRS